MFCVPFPSSIGLIGFTHLWVAISIVHQNVALYEKGLKGDGSFHQKLGELENENRYLKQFWEIILKILHSNSKHYYQESRYLMFSKMMNTGASICCGWPGTTMSHVISNPRPVGHLCCPAPRAGLLLFDIPADNISPARCSRTAPHAIGTPCKYEKLLELLN